MHNMVGLRGSVFIIAISVMLAVGVARADVDVTKYPLGMSPKELHDKLVADKFVFEAFTADEIRAVKKIAIDTNRGTEYPDAIQSTNLKANICAGKVFKITMASVYSADRGALLIGRKSFYKYLKDNNAVNDSIQLHQAETNPSVVLGYSIDRNSQTNKSVRGNEVAKLSLGTSRKIVAKDQSPLLQMTYFLENKWFCPN